MFIDKLIRNAETAVNRFSLMGKSDAETDEKFYDTSTLTKQEREQAYTATAAQTAPEGSIFLINPGAKSTGFEVFFCPHPNIHGQARAKAVVDLFEDYLRSKRLTVDTVVIPGCGSSPVGAAAFGKTVAETIGKPVAAIVAGQGAMDQWCEAFSGGLLMAPSAKFLNMFDRPLEFLVKANPFVASWARSFTKELVDSIHEAGTLLALMKRRLLHEKYGVFELRDAEARHFDMIVSHSKGNWAVQAALLNFELDLAARIERPDAIDRRIDVVTFGNWVELPDQDELVKSLFHYHQFVGTHDLLALLNSPPQALAKLVFGMKFDFAGPGDRSSDPDEMLFLGRSHNLVASEPDHMPIRSLLRQISVH